MKINIQNLEQNLLEVEGKVETDFLESGLREYYPRPLEVWARLDHFGKDYKVDVKIHTRAVYVCDRCLRDYDYDFSAKLGQVYQTGKNGIAADDDIVELATNDTEIDTAPLIREAIILNHPIKMICRDDCKGFCPDCGADLNNEKCTCAEDKIDPRWAELKKLIK